MVLIGALNLAVGFCSYEPPPPPPQQLILSAPALPPGTIALGEIPVEVMRAFVAQHPQTAPAAARKLVAADGAVTYEITFGSGSAARTASYTADGAAVTPK